MEPIFENITVETEQILKEYILFTNRKGFQRNRVIMGIGAAAFLYLGISWHSVPLLLGAAAYVGLLVWQFIVPGHATKKAIKRKLAFYNQENPPLTYRFLDDHFELSDVDSWHSTPYDKIESITRLKSCIVVKARNGSGFPISLDGFQKGTPEELIEFLRSKCPQLNSPNWNW